MLTLYRCLLYLYPTAYRRECAEEMTTVFRQAQTATRSEALATRALFYAREIPGLLSGALQEHFRRVAGSYDLDFHQEA